MGKYFDKLNIYQEKAASLKAAMNLFDYDTQTNSPARADELTSKVMGILADEYHSLFTGKKSDRLIKKCRKEYENGDYTAVECAILKQYIKTHNELSPIPADEYRAFKELTSKSVNVWVKAKQNKSFEDFAPVLEEIVRWKRKFAGYRKLKGQKEYDVLLGDYEPDFDMKKLDDIFDVIKKEVLPVVKMYRCKSCECSGKVDNTEDSESVKSFGTASFDKNKMRKLCVFLSEYLGFDKDAGVISESEHPFTMNIHKYDVRMTNNYSKGDFFGPVFSAIHETGHALYEQGIDDSIAMTIIGEGTSMGMHEAQSRFYENMVGRNIYFWKPLMGKVRKMFPDEMKDMSEDDFIKMMNKVNCGPIRIDADELTYPFHIIIRYELEKSLISGTIKVSELKDEWNRKYKQYLGVLPKDDAEGVLQDVHWATGEFGYFPSYVIGSATAAQLCVHIKSVMQFDRCLEEGDVKELKKYLTKNIFRYGRAVTTNEILERMMGEKFDVRYYVRYLCDKYGKEKDVLCKS